MMKAEDLAYEIADEYLPDVNILGVDGPNTGLAGAIINKVLDAVDDSVKETFSYSSDPKLAFTASNMASVSINELRPAGNGGGIMTDEEFNKLCAEVMGYKWGVWAASIMPGNNETWEGYKDSEGYEVNMHAAGDLNQMAEVFDKLWQSESSAKWDYPFIKRMHKKGIAKAMREFIESTIDNLKCINSKEIESWLWEHCQIQGHIADSVKDERGVNIKWVDRETGEEIDIIWGTEQ